MELPKNYLAVQIGVARLFGVDFLTENENVVYQVYSKLFLFTIAYLNTFEEIYEAYVNIRNPETLIVILSYIGLHAPGMIQTTVVFKNRKIIGDLIKRIHGGIFAPQWQRGGLKESLIIKNAIRKTRIHSAVVALVTFMAILNSTIVFVTIRLTQPPETWDAPFIIKFSLFDTHSSPSFELVFAFQWISICMFPLLISFVDLTIVGVIAHLQAQLKILQNSLRDVKAEGAKYEASGPNEMIKECVRHHLEIISIRNEIEDLFNLPILFTFIANVAQMCFVMYQATRVPLFGFEFGLKVFHTLYVTLQFYIYCYWCNEVEHESRKVAQAAFDCDWIGESVDFQKYLVLVMLRAQKPLKLTAGKISDLSMQTFTSIMRASLSYFTILYKIRNRL